MQAQQKNSAIRAEKRIIFLSLLYTGAADSSETALEASEISIAILVPTRDFQQQNNIRAAPDPVEKIESKKPTENLKPRITLALVSKV